MHPSLSSYQDRSKTPWLRCILPNTPQSTVRSRCRTCHSDRDCSYRSSRSCCTVPRDTAIRPTPSLPHCTHSQDLRYRRLSSWPLSDLSHCRRRLVGIGSTRLECRCCIDRLDRAVPSTAPLQHHSTNQQERCTHQSMLAKSHLRQRPPHANDQGVTMAPEGIASDVPSIRRRHQCNSTHYL